MSDKVYVITRGHYSDYHVCAVTMDEERAKKLCEMYSGRYEQAMIEEYILDDKREFWLFKVEFDAKTHECVGTVVEEWRCYRDGDTHSNYTRNGKVDCFWVEAADEDHARKIAQDRCAEKRAREAGIV